MLLDIIDAHIQISAALAVTTSLENRASVYLGFQATFNISFNIRQAEET
jgi:hypothetical protein